MNEQAWELFRAGMRAADNYRRARYNFTTPSWVGPTWQPIPSTFRKCVWCKDHLSVFGPPTADLGDGWAHQECVDKAERFALKSSIRHRINPTTGYFPGWNQPERHAHTAWEKILPRGACFTYQCHLY